MPNREVQLEFPAAGLDRRMAYEKQGPFSTPQCVNVRSVDADEKKRRGGSRAWLSKKFPTLLGGGNPINLLNSLRTTNTSGSLVFLDLLDSSTNYDAASWADDGLPAFTDSEAVGGVSAHNGAILKSSSVPAIEQSAERTVYIYIPLSTWGIGTEYWIHASMDATTPVQANSIECSAIIDSSNFWTLTVYENHVARDSITDIAFDSNASGWLALTITTDKITAKWQSNRGIWTARHSGDFTSVAGNAAGFSMVGSSVVAPKISTFRIDYTSNAGAAPPELIMAASNGQLYAEKPLGTMVAVGTNITLETEPIQSVTRLSKLYIADWAVPRREVTGATVTITAAGVMTDLNATFATAGDTFVILDGDVIEVTAISGGSTDISTGWYKVTAVASNTVLTFKTLAGANPGSTGTATTVTYRIVPGLKVYDTLTDATTLWVATSGVLPYGCRLISKFRDTIMLSGDPNNEGVWYMSSVNDVNNWTESSTDVRSAVFGTSTDSGYVIGSKIVSTIPYTKDYHIVATEQDCWLFRGHPRQGGGIDALSNTVGIIGPWSWAVDDSNVLYFLSKNGLFRITEQQATVLEEPTPISRERIPKELVDVDTKLYEVFMGYDPERMGVYIHVVPKSVGSASLWFYDTQLGAFFPDTLADEHQPLSMTYSGVYNDVLFGCRDGYVRYFNEDATSDDGIVQETNVDIGPFRLDGGRTGMVDSLEVVLDESSSDVDWEFRTGNSAEEAFTSSSLTTGTASPGINYRQGVRQSGEWGFLRLKTTEAARWSLERVRLMIQRGGISRKI